MSSQRAAPQRDLPSAEVEDWVEILTAEWARQQQKLRLKVVAHDAVPWSLDTRQAGDPGGASGQEVLRRVGGLDISFAKEEAAGGDSGGHREHDVAALVVLSFPELELLYEDCMEVSLNVPYVSSFLGFREVPAFCALLERVRGTPFAPQVLLVDGFGQLHQRGCGSASHLGVVCGLPTVGVGKTLVALDGLSERAVRSECAAAIAAQRERASQEGGGAAEAGREGPPPHCQQDLCLPLRGASGGAPLGMAVCKTGTSRPIFVSVGHRLSLPTATRLVLACSRHRVPEPIRQADLRSRAFIRERLPM
eukprot:jgi/Tetstr1/444349/TSEL_032240.t1